MPSRETLGNTILGSAGAAFAQEYSLRFNGHGVSAPDLDRVINVFDRNDP